MSKFTVDGLRIWVMKWPNDFSRNGININNKNKRFFNQDIGCIISCYSDLKFNSNDLPNVCFFGFTLIWLYKIKSKNF